MLQKVEQLSKLGKMSGEIEVLGALSAQQKAKHFLAASSTAADRKSKTEGRKRSAAGAEAVVLDDLPEDVATLQQMVLQMRAKHARLEADFSAEVRIRRQEEMRTQVAKEELEEVKTQLTKSTKIIVALQALVTRLTEGTDSENDSSSSMVMGSDGSASP